MTSGYDSPYARFGDKGPNDDGRRVAAQARLSPYQLDKLKFLVCSMLKKGEVENMENAGGVYALLEAHYAGDKEKATATLCVLLGDVSHKSRPSSRSLTDSDILDIEEYKWRLKIIEHADDLRKQKKTLHHFHKQFDLESSDDTFSSPIKMFEHMIETDKLRVGETADLKKVEEVTTSFHTRRTWRRIMLLVAVVTSAAFVISLLLSLIKFTNLANLQNSRTIYYSIAVTLLMGVVFDLRYYDEISVTITPQADLQRHFGVSLCQTTCNDDNIVSTLDLNFSGAIEASRNRSQKGSIDFPDHEFPKYPGLFMLEKSEIRLSFVHVRGTLFSNSTVSLYVFTDVTDCTEFNNGNEADSLPTTQRLTQKEGFEYTFTAPTNDFVCIIAEIPGRTVFNYTVTGRVLQFHNLSRLADDGLCEANKSTIIESPGDGKTLTLNLRRPFGRTSAPTTQQTCVLLVVSDINSPAYSVFETDSVIFGTNSNIGVVSLSVCPFLFIAGVMSLVCVLRVCAKKKL